MAKPRFLAIDLQPKANQKLDADFHGYDGNNLTPLPRGKQKLGDVEFVIGEKFIQLAGKRAPDFPDKVEGIPVGRKVSKLHFLHATGWGSPNIEDGTPIGAYVIHYDDKTSETIRLEYGRDIRDWWNLGGEEPLTNAVVAWTGVNDASKDFRGRRVQIRLYRLTWKNPHPGKVVTGFDYVSRNDSICAPFLVAAAGEPTEDEQAAIRALKDLGAFLEFDERGWLTGVSLSGPGPRRVAYRGTDAAVSLLSDLPTIERLYLNSAAISDAGLVSLENLQNLRWLSLNLSTVTDAGMVHLKELKSLERLRLHDTWITDAGVAELASLRNLQVLDLSQTSVSDAGVSRLGELKSLKEVDLRDTHVTPDGAARLRDALKDVRVAR